MGRIRWDVPYPVHTPKSVAKNYKIGSKYSLRVEDYDSKKGETHMETYVCIKKYKRFGVFKSVSSGLIRSILWVSGGIEK